MKFFLIAFFCLISEFYFSQIRYYSQGFENTSVSCPENWSYTGGQRNNQHSKSGNYSNRVGRAGESNTLILNPVDVSQLSNAELRLSHSVLGGNGPGMDVREGAIFLVSLNGGAYFSVSKVAGTNDHSYTWNQIGGVGQIGCVAPNDLTFQSQNTFIYPIPVGTQTISVKVISINIQTGANAAARCTNFVSMMNSASPIASDFDRNDEGIYIDDVEIWAEGPTVLPSISICENLPFSVGVQNTNSGMTYSWSGPNSFTSSIQNPQVTTNSIISQSGTYSNTIQFAGCPIITLNQTVTINPSPQISISGNLNFCSGNTTLITASGGTTYNWSDGLGATPTVSIGNAGAYTVTVTSANNCSSQESILIQETISQVNDLIASGCDSYTWSINNQTYTTSGNYTIVNGCVTENLALTITPNTQNTTSISACDSYLWTQNNVVYTQSGVYTEIVGCHTEILNLTLTPSSTVTSSVNACNSYTWSVNNQTYTISGIYTEIVGCVTQILDLRIDSNPILSFNNPTICQGETAILSVTSNQNQTSFVWSNGQTGSDIFVSPTVSTTYSVIGVNEVGCSSTGIGSVNVIPSPQLIYQDTSICLGQSSIISVLPVTAGGTFLWSTGETTASIQVTPTQNTVYSVQYTLNSCQSSIANINVIIASPAVLNVNNPNICLGSIATLNASASVLGGVFTWENGFIGNSVSFTPIADTVVYFTYILNGCISVDSAQITVLNLPTFNFSASQIEGCSPLSVSFSTPFIESTNCSWKIDGVEVSTNCGNLNYTFTNTNCYDVSLIAQGTNGCSNTIDYTDLICVFPNPSADFYHNELANFQTSVLVGFSNSSLNSFQNWWDFGDGYFITNQNNPTHTYFLATESNFDVKLIVESEQGCQDSITKRITFKDELIVFVPNTFTPDGNGTNEIWLPIFSTFVNQGNYECNVFNSFGERIFYTNDYTQGWDGTYKGFKVQDGTYNYYIEYAEIDKTKTTILKGHINLLK